MARVTSAHVAEHAHLDPYRLPRGAVPTRYDVELAPDLDAATFDGRVEIAVDVLEPVDEIVLNATELDVLEARVDGSDVHWHLEPETERLVVRPVGGLQPGQVTVVISFTGTLNDKLRGFYRSTYRDDAGTEHVIATTQMQATDCRRSFPCWDEPDFKAVFGVTLVIDPALFAVSNQPEIERRERPGGKVAVRFADTMVMSTYLVAFVVGPLEATDAVDVDGIPLRIIHVPGKGHLTGFGLDIGAFALRWFQDYYGIPYPADKVDLLALPDFAAGAMENLGCITFRENLLLVDPATATMGEQQLVADVVAHELAHMWFGDLVTMRWWNGIWLNEAFATFMELAACDAYRPDWSRWTLFGLERSAALETDSLRSTRPVEYEVRSPHGVRGHVRRPDLPEGRRPAAHARAVPRRRALPPGREPLPPSAPVREHRDERPLGRHRGDQRRAGAADDGLVDLAARLPLAVGFGRGRRPRAAPAALRLRHRDARRRRQADDVARTGPRPSRLGGDDRAVRQRGSPGPPRRTVRGDRPQRRRSRVLPRRL